VKKLYEYGYKTLIYDCKGYIKILLMFKYQEYDIFKHISPIISKKSWFKKSYLKYLPIMHILRNTVYIMKWSVDQELSIDIIIYS